MIWVKDSPGRRVPRRVNHVRGFLPRIERRAPAFAKQMPFDVRYEGVLGYSQLPTLQSSL